MAKTAIGSIIGLAGQVGMLDEVVAWLNNGGKREEYPKLPENGVIHGIIACLDGRVASLSADGILQWMETDFMAAGSGNEIALGAMAMGATAEQAVEIAARFDVYTGGKIETLSLRSPSRPTEEDAS